MIHKLIITSIVLSMGFNAIAQSNLDSLVSLRKTDAIEGKLLTYYTAGHEEAARGFQETISEAIDYFEAKYSKEFHVKLAVLDSSQWLDEIYPFGFVFYADGWIVMNTGMDYDSFTKVYGLKSFSERLDNELSKSGIHPTEMINSFFKFYSIHELGHYFMDNLSEAKSPDNWTNEFSATYLSYEYLFEKKPKDLKVFELFCEIDKHYYSPRYATIEDFNDKYAGTGLENYLWYHSNFYFLAKSLYECRGDDFISAYEREFPKESNKNLSTDEIIGSLDKDCMGLVRRWITQLEQKAQK